MKIACIGGGPAGLYFSILMKKSHPEAQITVYERNRPDDTFGFGVVFSDETLGHFRDSDPESFAAIQQSFAYWSDIEIWYGGKSIRSTGHGFCGLSRKKLLEIFHARCLDLGVELVFQHDVKDDGDLPPVDLVLAADGVNSMMRQKYAASFRPTIHQGKCRFTWLGTTLPLQSFTFVFRANQHGLFQVHAYPFEVGAKPQSTWIVECHEDTWRRAGLDTASEAETVAYFEDLFADHLRGHRLLTNRSIWRSFPTISCASWQHENIVLMGDAAHTAHFSIGSGTKLAMEDAIALEEAFRENAGAPVPAVLRAYEQKRMVDTIKLQKTAQTSREWFENSARYQHQAPLPFAFNLLTRSRRITWDNLKKRDPALVTQVADWVATEAKSPRRPGKPAPAPMFAPYSLRSLKLSNRVVVSPMCQYSAKDGLVNDWHLVHLGSRAVGGAALVFTEATGVSPTGRITYGCTGMWNDAHEAGWKRIVDFVHQNSAAKIGIQLAHAGRKASCHLPWEGDNPLRDHTAWQTIGPSAEPFSPGWPVPREMTRRDMDEVKDQFTTAIARALRAGFDLIELHMAHGYALSSFLSPKANRRTDAYGGSRENRMRWPLEVFAAARAAWPADKAIAVRISASDWLDDAGGQTVEDSVAFARELKALGCDIIDVSSAGNTPESKPEYGRMYQVSFAERIRYEAEIPVIAVGGIQNADHVNSLIAAGRADLCAIARPHLLNPYLTLGAAAADGNADVPWPNQYLAVRPRAD